MITRDCLTTPYPTKLSFNSPTTQLGNQ
ncbi:hypothetical protein NC653_022358 [Populus alba x Populus x berolinensis]|uniref:Uncharacterized protein n=1 Tax=Populus alba x Populus x berolinensis TaxID=444605 RepID=A0AAD6Q9L5_9ROSI|nr:hypothetical protein NC653_022358 [Populus alba x Populus x berolinensis]